MAGKTSLLGLWKPEKTGEVVEGLNQFNSNMDVLDAAMAKAYRGKTVHNILGNSDLLHPINQRGTTSTKTNGDYIADRWIVNISNSAATVSIGSGGITLEPTNSNYVSIYQKLEHYAELSGKVCTLGVCINGVWEATTFTMANESGGKLLPCGLRVYSTGNTYQVMIRNLAGAAPVTIQRVVLYEGTYTAATLPEYQPKGYAVELIECMRYYQTVYRVYGASVGNVTREAILLRPRMRVAPTVTKISGWEGSSGAGYTVQTSGAGYIDIQYTGWGNVSLGLSADL